jgi:bacterioferritin-associated ferredoxin
MLVCLCHAINETKVDAAIRDGARSYRDVLGTYGARPNCCRCQNEIEDRIGDVVGGGSAAGPVGFPGVSETTGRHPRSTPVEAEA